MKARTLLLAASLLLPVALGSCGSDSASKGCQPRAVAWLGALTGPARRPPHQNGAELAVHLYNAAHPECPVGYLFYDSQGDPDVAKRLARSIVDDPQIIAVVGPGFSGESAKAIPLFDKVDLATITASATNPTLAEQGWHTFHRVVSNDSTQAPAAVAFLAEQLHVKRVAVVDDGSLYGQALADIAAKDFGNRGIVVAPRTALNPEGLDYGAIVSSIAEIGVDAVYYGGYIDPAVRLLRQLRDAGVTAAFMGGDEIGRAHV